MICWNYVQLIVHVFKTCDEFYQHNCQLYYYLGQFASVYFEEVTPFGKALADSFVEKASYKDLLRIITHVWYLNNYNYIIWLDFYI